MKRTKRFLMTLALLLTAVSGAWARDTFFIEVSGTSATMKYGAPGTHPQYLSGMGFFDQRSDDYYSEILTIETLTIDESCKNHSLTLTRLFYVWNALTTINNIENLKTEGMTNMSEMFGNCRSLTTLDLSGWNTENVTGMRSMFSDCSSLTTLDLSGWNTENVTDMGYMFYNCSSLTTLDLSGWNTGKVKSMASMFSGCSNLENIYVGDDWSTEAVTNGSYMFGGCVKLPNYDANNVGVTNAHTGAGGYLKTAPFADIELTPTSNPNEWTFEMIDDDVELEVVYYSLAGVTLADGSGAGGTATLLKEDFSPLTADDKVREDRRFVLLVDRADGYDFDVTLSTGDEAAMTEFSEEEYEQYLAYAKQNNIDVPLTTVLMWVTMPHVETETLTVTPAFEPLKLFTVMYKTTATNVTDVWCRLGITEGAKDVFRAAKMESDTELGDGTRVWSLKVQSAFDPSKAGFFTTQEAAEADGATVGNATVSTSATAWTDNGDGQCLIIGGQAKTVAAAFVTDGSKVPFFNGEDVRMERGTDGNGVTYRLAACPTDAQGNVTTPGSITTPAPAVPEGMTFGGWIVMEGTAPAKTETLYTSNANVSISENTIFTALWLPMQLTTTLNANGGTDVNSPVVTTYGNALGISGEPTRKGFAFNGWTVNKTVNEGGVLFGKGSKFDMSTLITNDLDLTAQWKHVHEYNCYRISQFGDALAGYQHLNGTIHIGICGCDDIILAAHEFNSAGRCPCGLVKPGMETPVRLETFYGQLNGNTFTTFAAGFPEDAKKGSEVKVDAPHNWGNLEFQKWQYSTDGTTWHDLAAFEIVGFLIPCNIQARALYVNPVTTPTVELATSQYDDKAVQDGQTYTMDNILFQMNYKLPDGYKLLDAGVRMGDNSGISYYEQKERRYSMDGEAKAIATSICVVTSILDHGINTYESSASETYYAERENSVLDEMTAATLAKKMYESKPINVPKYDPIYWEAQAQTKSLFGTVATLPPLRFAQKNNQQHYIYGIGYIRYQTPDKQTKTLYTPAIAATVKNPYHSISASEGQQASAPARMAARSQARKAPAEDSAEDVLDMRYVFAPETQLTVYVDGEWSADLSDSYGFGDKVTLEAPAVSGKTFSYWEADGQAVSNSQTLTLTMNAHTTLRAVYDGSAESAKAGFTSVTRSGDRISLQAIADAQATEAGIVYSTTATGDALTIGGEGVTQVAAERLTDTSTTLPASVLDGNNCWMLQISPESESTVYHARVYATVGGSTVYSDVRDVKLADLASGIMRIANLSGFEEGLDEALAEAKNTVATMTLDETEDNTAWLTDNDGAMYDITLTRTLQTGGWNTFSVPFSIPGSMYGAYSLTAVKTLADAEFNGETGVLSLTFADAIGIEAGKPYLVKVSETVENPAFGIVTVSGTPTATETEAVDFIPTLGKTEVTGDAKSILFLGGSNTLYYPTELPADMKGFRAYFALKGEAAQAPVRSFRMDFGDGVATGIISVQGAGSTVDGSDGWYTLDGRKLQGQPMQKGVYIVRPAKGRLQGKNGKKVIK